MIPVRVSFWYEFIPVPTCALCSFTWYRYEMLYLYKSYWYEFIPVPNCSSVFVYMILVRNVVLVQVIPVRVHPSAHPSSSVFTWYWYKMLYWYKSYRYKFILVLILVEDISTGMKSDHHSGTISRKGGMGFCSGTRWVAELTGMGRDMRVDRQQCFKMACKNEGLPETSCHSGTITPM